ALPLSAPPCYVAVASSPSCVVVPLLPTLTLSLPEVVLSPRAVALSLHLSSSSSPSRRHRSSFLFQRRSSTDLPVPALALFRVR
ncbi:hypothetical protein PIB30_106332, partial [Stylosanthes scabra]|nr:hypothetical protein [Stylosanthes scabra]